MIIFLKNKHTLQIDEFYFKCCMEKMVYQNKKEGDKKTPKGILKLKIYILEKIELKNQKQIKNVLKLNKNMGWCNDIKFSKKI